MHSLNCLSTVLDIYMNFYFVQSCKHESWKIISKYLMEQVPQLLKAEGFDSIEKILSAVFESLPANLTDFIKWIAEVRRLESSEKTVDKEEAERIAIKVIFSDCSLT